MKREKIGDSYFRLGYGRTTRRKANVYLIDGFCYAKDSQSASSFDELPSELTGYVRVNISTGVLGINFYQCRRHEHEKYTIPV